MLTGLQVSRSPKGQPASPAPSQEIRLGGAFRRPGRHRRTARELGLDASLQNQQQTASPSQQWSVW